MREEASRRAEQPLGARREWRDEIEQATDLIVARLDVTRAAARRLIRERGFETGRFVGEVAAEIIGGPWRLGDQPGFDLGPTI